jgi:hypothetical protein
MKTSTLLIGAGALAAAYLFSKTKAGSEQVAVVDTSAPVAAPISASQASAILQATGSSLSLSSGLTRGGLTSIGAVIVTNRSRLDKLRPFSCTDGKVRNLTDPTWLCPTPFDKLRPFKCTDGKVRNLPDATWLCPTLSTQATPLMKISGGFLG